MRFTGLTAAIVSAMLFVSATAWEGVSAMVDSGDLPGVYSVATNSFPKNSMVDITNLENGKMVRVLVVSGLETTGLLAILSVNAAEAIDMRGGASCRIRMTQPPDDIAFSQFRLGPIASVERPVSETEALLEGDTPEAPDMAQAEPEQAADTFADEPAAGGDSIAADDAIPEDITDDIAGANLSDENPPETGIASGQLVLKPAEERLPETTDRFVIAPEDIIAPIEPAAKPVSSVQGRTAGFSPFQAPLISSLEQGKCYVQIGVYARPNNVEDEITRIGTGYPVAIQNVGSDTKPMFRVLLGPLNQGESVAMLQRFKSIGYADAFVRRN